ncbi:MAG TPA: ribonuclease R [Bacteroidales bacterium]|nr:ribonuclease R [Bacteroidales bacterium]
MSKKKKNKSEGPEVDKKSLIGNIMNVFQNNSGQSFNYRQVCRQLLIEDQSTRHIVSEILLELVQKGDLDEVRRGKYVLAAKTASVTGIIDLTQAGYGFVKTEEFPDDIFVSMKNLNHALHGDQVKVHIFARKKQARPEGEVIEIIERARKTFVGTIEISKNFAFLVADGKQMPYDLFIPLRSLNGAKNGQKAIAKITEWPAGGKNPIGEVIEVIGFPGTNETEMHSILAEFELPYKFPEDVEAAAAHLPVEIPAEEYKKRRDFRKVPTFTIDPKDAKDFDDALSIQKLPNGNWEIGVHIADVTYYIDTKSILEEEARVRATSVYLVDRVVPMLPEKLSNMVCSLRPFEEKLCYSAVFEMDDNARIISEWFGRTIINSQRRFAYEEAQEVIDKEEGDMRDEILKLHNLAQRLREQRFKNGAIAFERDEVRFDIDPTGKPLKVYFKEMGESNQLIEEFMLLANKKVAEFCSEYGKEPRPEKLGKGKTFVYRIHDVPNMEKLDAFASFVHKFGYNIRTNSNKKISESLNSLLDNVKGKKEQNLIETLALRSMAKARYATNNIGHYGLAFHHYTHFTSPIRRYPDMMVHRLLTYYLEGGKPPDQEFYELLCKHSSEMEKRAIDAERASIKYKQVEFMADKIGEVYEGVISGVTEWGIFVELVENKCEGLVSVRDLTDDFYELDEENYCIIGRRSNKRFQLGDAVKVEVYRTNLSKKQLDFRLIE